MILRRAEISDSKYISLLLIESITINCVQDHKGNPKIIKSWCENKTPENIAIWIADPKNSMIVTQQSNEETLDGVGLISKDGEILLCYVSPNSIGKNIGNALLHRLEDEAFKFDIKNIYLNSTHTAHSFYQKKGYIDNGEIIQLDDSRFCFPMNKVIK